MNEFELLRRGGLDTVRYALLRRGLSEAEALSVTDLLSTANLPGFLGVSASGSNGDTAPPTGDELLDAAAAAAAAHPEMKDAAVDVSMVRALLRALLIERRPLREVVADDGLRARLLDVGLMALEARTGLSLTAEERRQTGRLLTAREFFGGAPAATAAVLCTVPSLGVPLARDVRRSPLRLARLGAAVGADLEKNGRFVPVVLADLLTGGDLGRPPAVLERTLEVLYEFGSLDATAEMLSTMIAPANESVRLAIVVYACANGVALGPQGLETLRQDVLSAEQPDLGPIMTRAAERLLDAHGHDRLLRLLGRLAV
jgi:hypothetical protein